MCSPSLVSLLKFNFVSSQVDGMAPTFSTKPTIRQQEKDSSTLVFHCSIMAEPRPSITWYRDGVKVQDSDAKFQVKYISSSNSIVSYLDPLCT